jgi:hypothetical protein
LILFCLMCVFADFLWSATKCVCMYRPWGFSRTTVVCVLRFQYFWQFWEWRRIFSKMLTECWKSVFCNCLCFVMEGDIPGTSFDGGRAAPPGGPSVVFQWSSRGHQKRARSPHGHQEPKWIPIHIKQSEVSDVLRKHQKSSLEIQGCPNGFSRNPANWTKRLVARFSIVEY